MFGSSKVTEYGYRQGSKDVWCDSKSAAEKAIARINKSVKKGGTPVKLIQRTTTKKMAKQASKCSGGKCRGDFKCPKHSKGEARGMTSSHKIANGVQPILRPDGKPF